MKKNKKITVFIIDDNLPKRKEFIQNNLYDRELSSKHLKILIESESWKGEVPLLSLTNALLNSNYSKKGMLKVFGFLHPEICLNAIRAKLKPDIIIYDWEYGDHLYQKSSNWLFQILNEAKKAFVFVYSDYIDQAPPFLNKEEFIPFAERFQLFLKGEKENSIFSSEEFILQYILTRIQNNNVIKIQGIDVEFKSNGYLKKPRDILFIERILGKGLLIKKINEVGNKINKENLDKIFDNSSGSILYSADKKFLIDPDDILNVENFNAQEKLSYLQVVQKYGTEKLVEVLEAGFVRVG